MFYLELCEHGQRLICWVLLGVIKGHAILVEEMLQMSVSGTFFSGPTSFLGTMTSQSAAGEVLEKAICLDAGLLRQKQKCAQGFLFADYAYSSIVTQCHTTLLSQYHSVPKTSFTSLIFQRQGRNLQGLLRDLGGMPIT